MSRKQKKFLPVLYRISLILIFTVSLFLIIAYARGYRLNFKQKALTPTGIISVSSYPRAAKVYVNGVLKGVTDINITLPPGTYSIEVKKDGYSTWKKKYRLKGELVLTADVFLYPLNASLTPLSTMGVVKGYPVDQTDKIIIFSQAGIPEKDGVYVFDRSKNPFLSVTDPKLLFLKQLLPEAANFSTSNLFISPDGKEGILELTYADETSAYYLISLENETTQLFDVTLSKDAILNAWEQKKEEDTTRVLATYPKEFQKVATDSMRIIAFSPDRLKVMYTATQSAYLKEAITPPIISANQEPEERLLEKGTRYLYDTKEDRNYKVAYPETKEEIKDSDILWYVDSEHMLLNVDGHIYIQGFDNSNLQVVYSGPHEGTFFDVLSDGKLIILANLNPQINLLPDLYAVGIR